MKTNEIKHQGFKYYYRIYKNEKQELDPIFFVSGAFQNMDSWKLIANYFMKKTTVIVADLPGMGLADHLPYEYDLDFLVDSIYLILEDASINKVYMISASYGTPICYKFAKKYPEKVSLLTLAGTMKELPKDLKENISESIQIAKKGNAQEFAKFVLKNGLMYNDKDADCKINRFELVKRMLSMQLNLLDKSSMNKFVSNSKRLLQETCLNFDNSPNLKTLIFTGEYDVFTTPESCRKFAQNLNDSTFTTIKKADHLFHLEQTKTTIELLYRFGTGCKLDGIKNCNEIESFYLQNQLAS